MDSALRNAHGEPMLLKRIGNLFGWAKKYIHTWRRWSPLQLVQPLPPLTVNVAAGQGQQCIIWVLHGAICYGNCRCVQKPQT
eukprot:3260536-Pyramimonas_sp.AAC.1